MKTFRGTDGAALKVIQKINASVLLKDKEQTLKLYVIETKESFLGRPALDIQNSPNG